MEPYAFAQDNVKRRIACSSVSHMGFVLLGIGAVDALGISGAMLQMISHGLIAAAMFFVTGSFYERTNTCLLYTSPSPRDLSTSRMPSSA